MKIYYKNRQIEIPARKVSPVGKIAGLMFRTKETENLLFEFSKETSMRMHSYFVLFPFLAIWLDEEDNVVDFKIVNPFALSVSSKKPFFKMLELPFNNKNTKIIDFFVGKNFIRGGERRCGVVRRKDLNRLPS